MPFVKGERARYQNTMKGNLCNHTKRILIIQNHLGQPNAELLHPTDSMKSKARQFRDAELHGFGFQASHNVGCGLIGGHHKGFPRGLGQFGIDKSKTNIGDRYSLRFEFQGHGNEVVAESGF
jgi:hypothetical protein